MKKSFIIMAISVMLCAAILLSGAVLVFAADAEKYTGRILMAVNTETNCLFSLNGYYSFQKGETDAAEKQTESKNSHDGAVYPDVIDEVTPASAEEYEAYLKVHANEPQAIIENDYKIGDTMNISAHYYDADNNGKITVKCLYVGKGCTVWSQLYEDGTTFDAEESAKAAGEFFDSVHKAEEEVFGKNVIDTDGDGKFALISYNVNTKYNVAGYFVPADVVNKFGFLGKVFAPSVISGSNHMDCVYLKGLKQYNINGTIAHEYQHYLFNCTSCYGKTNFDYLSFEEQFVDEGFSRCAEVIFAEDEMYISSAMKRAGDDIDLTGTFNDWDSYEISGSFCSYLRNRYAILTNDNSKDFAGKGFYLEYHSRRNKVNQSYSMGIFGDILYPADKYPELEDSAARAKQLLIDFWKAVLLREETGIYGFNGEEAVNGFYCEEYLPYVTEKLNPGMAKFYIIDSGKKADAVLKSKSDNIYIEAMDYEKIINVVFDPNYEGAPEPVSAAWLAGEPLGVPYELRLRFGYKLAGWSKRRDASEPEFDPYSDIYVDSDTVFYAVWEKLPEVRIGVEYDFDDEYGAGVIFSPEETGYYTITSDYGFFFYGLEVYSEEGYPQEKLEPCGIVYGEDKAEVTFSMKKGERYAISLLSCKFIINKETESHKLTFVSEKSYETKTLEGRSEYQIPEFWEDFENLEGDSLLVGWSLKKDSETPDYNESDIIEITGDTVLYAVHKPYTELKEGVEYKSSDRFDEFFVFTPGSDGSYGIDAREDSLSIAVYDENRNRLGYINSDRPEMLSGAFAGGHKYYLNARAAEITDFEIKKISDKTDTEICFLISGEEIYSDSGKSFYTAPGYEPESYEAPPLKYWRSTSYSADGEYKPGDTVFVLRDIQFRGTMMSIWDYDPGYTYCADEAAFNKDDNRRYFTLYLPSKTVYRIKGEGGLAYYEEPEEIERSLLWCNTDDGCFLYSPVDTSVIIMLDPEITGFSIDTVEDKIAVTFSAEGAENVPEPVVTKGISYIPDVIPEKENMEFIGWKLTYTFRGEEQTEVVGTDSIFLAPGDTVLTAEFTRLTLIEIILNWILEHIINPIFGFLI